MVKLNIPKRALISESNADDRTRTCNLRFRRPMLYPVELHPHRAGWEGYHTSAYSATTELTMRVDFLATFGIISDSPNSLGTTLRSS